MTGLHKALHAFWSGFSHGGRKILHFIFFLDLISFMESPPVLQKITLKMQNLSRDAWYYGGKNPDETSVQNVPTFIVIQNIGRIVNIM